jgi:hypothetical protein
MNRQQAGLASIEAPTMVHTNGAPPVLAIIEHASAAECRMRSVNFFEVGAELEFSIAIHGAPTVALRGTVVSRRQNGSRHEYIVTLRTTIEQAEAIAKATQLARERAASHLPDVQTGNRLTRTNLRIPVDFALRYTQPGAEPRSARATNLSIGGILMNTDDLLPIGTSIQMDLPIEDFFVTVLGRIVAHQAMSPNYNVAFYEVRKEAHDSIMRFIDEHLIT